MIRVCPHSDARCVHGMSCAYTCATDNYDGNKNLSEAMSAELAPCPFCGGKARTFDYNGTAQATCAGDFTECAGADGYSPVAMWNRRAHPPQPDALPGDLREKIAGIIVRKVLQEDYDDLVEGYLDEILMAADEIILLPAYRAVAEAYYSRLSLIQSERGEP